MAKTTRRNRPVRIGRIPKKLNVGDVSTAHITLSDSKKLNAGAVPRQIGSFEYGYVVLTHPESDAVAASQIRGAGMSTAYLKLLETAYAQGFYYLMIDQDAETVDGLETFKW